jgi:GNAT superfamily N-acetyltransferase
MTTIRDAKSEDMQILCEAWESLTTELSLMGAPDPIPGPKTTAYNRMLFGLYFYQAKPGLVLIAEDGGKFAGATFAMEIGESTNTALGYRPVRGLGTYVVPEHRGTGLAARLVNLLYTRLAEMGFDVLLGAASLSNERSIRFFKRRGFVPHTVLIAKVLKE